MESPTIIVENLYFSFHSFTSGICKPMLSVYRIYDYFIYLMYWPFIIMKYLYLSSIILLVLNSTVSDKLSCHKTCFLQRAYSWVLFLCSLTISAFWGEYSVHSFQCNYVVDLLLPFCYFLFVSHLFFNSSVPPLLLSFVINTFSVPF